MRSVSVQVQPARAPGLDMEAVTQAFQKLVADKSLVLRHSFDSGVDGTEFHNYTFGTHDAKALWQRIVREIYRSPDIGESISEASMAMCSMEDGWDDYLLLFHFDKSVAVDDEDAL